jgi:hypothetical protein
LSWIMLEGMRSFCLSIMREWVQSWAWAWASQRWFLGNGIMPTAIFLIMVWRPDSTKFEYQILC